MAANVIRRSPSPLPLPRWQPASVFTHTHVYPGRAMQEAGKRQARSLFRENSKRGARITRDRESRGGLGSRSRMGGEGETMLGIGLRKELVREEAT